MIDNPTPQAVANFDQRAAECNAYLDKLIESWRKLAPDNKFERMVTAMSKTLNERAEDNDVVGGFFIDVLVMAVNRLAKKDE